MTKVNLLRLVQTTTLALAMAAGVGSAVEAKELRLGTATTSIIVGPLLLADVMPELMSEQGIELKITGFHGKSSNCIAALLARSIDICIVGTTTGTSAIAEGASLTAVGGMSAPINEIILSKATVDKLPIDASASVEEKLKALDGLRIISAQPGSAHYLTLNHMLESVGLSVDNLQYQVLGDTQAMMNAIRNNAVDGAMWSAGALGGTIADGSGIRWISIPRGDFPTLAKLPYTTFFADSGWVEENADLVKSFQTAMAQAAKYIADHPEEAGKAIRAKYFPEMDDKIWQDGYAEAQSAYLEGGKIPRAGWDLFIELQSSSRKKDYSPAAYEKVVMPSAQTK